MTRLALDYFLHWNCKASQMEVVTYSSGRQIKWSKNKILLSCGEKYI